MEALQHLLHTGSVASSILKELHFVFPDVLVLGRFIRWLDPHIAGSSAKSVHVFFIFFCPRDKARACKIPTRQFLVPALFWMNS